MNNPFTNQKLCNTPFRRITRHKSQNGLHLVQIQAAHVPVHKWLDAQHRATPAWTFDGEMPGKLIEAKQGQITTVVYENDLEFSALKPFESHLDLDPAAPPPPPPMPGVMLMSRWVTDGLDQGVVPHLHGAVVSANFDGNPGVTPPIQPEQAATFVYPNNQREALLWYHDHSLDQTAGMVYAGLAAPYVIRGNYEKHLVAHHGLPQGERELFLVLQDKSFEEDEHGPTGRFTYHVPPNIEWAGDHILTNGQLRPFLKVEQQPYRLRILNATNGRFLKLFLRKQDDDSTITVAPLTWIGCDGGFLPAALAADEGQGIFLPPAGRADLIVDFSKLVPDSWKLITRIADSRHPYNNGFNSDGVSDENSTDIDVIMQFDVTQSHKPSVPFAPHHKLTDEGISHQDALDQMQALKAKHPEIIAPREVEMSLDEFQGPPLMQFINATSTVDSSGKTVVSPNGFHDPLIPAREVFNQGEWVRLKITNNTADAHPIHIHLVTFWVEGREDATGGINFFTPTQETGLLDTVWCPPGLNGGAVTTLLIKFPDDPTLTGSYMFHCHILEHEDHDMMRRFYIVPKLVL